MKKIMVFIAVIASAIAVNAASLAWGAAVCDPNGSDPIGSGSTAYLIYSTTAFSGLASTFDLEKGTTDNGGTMVQQYSITDADSDAYAFATTFNRADAAGGVNGFYQVLVTNPADSKQFAVLDLGSVSGITDTTSAGSLKVNMDWTGPAFAGDSGYIGTIGGGGGGVPEPTSGLLLVLGGAMLALRRKQK